MERTDTVVDRPLRRQIDEATSQGTSILVTCQRGAECPLRVARSTDRLNTGVEFIGRGLECQGLARPLVELARHFVQV